MSRFENPFAEFLASEPDEPRTAPLRSLREMLTDPRDLRNEIAFQNELNALLAGLSGSSALVPVAPLFTTPVPRPVPPRPPPFASFRRDTLEMKAFPGPLM